MWAMRRQESVSTYEEVESLNSHQVSTFTSLEGSSCPSRLESFGGSSTGSLDHGLTVQYANNNPPAFSAYQSHPHPLDPRALHPELQSPGSTDSSSRATSYSYPHSPGDLESPGPLVVEHDESGQEGDKPGGVNASVAKWVNQSYVQPPNQNTEKDGKLRLSPKTEGSSKADTASVRMDSMDRLDAETSPMTYRSMSPLQTFTRTASLDSGFPQFPGAGGFGMPWTPAENMLMTLGFGAVDFGIPERFMQSWRDNIIKRRIGELNHMLSGGQRTQRGPSNASLSRQPSETDSMEDFKITPKPRVSPPSPIQEQKEQEYQANQAKPKLVAEPKRDAGKVAPVPQPSEKQKQLEKLNMMRRRFKKAATVGSFSSHLLRQHTSQQSSSNSSPCSTPELQRRQSLPSGRKFNQLRPSERGSARERRRKFINRQSSLPISLETLPEEDEGQRSKPQSINDSFMTQMSMSIDVGKDCPSVPPLKIVTEQASLELAEAKSYNMHKQQSKDDAIADLQEAKKNLLNMEQYLNVIKTMIDSKDSGIGNEPSNEGSPQISPRASASGDDSIGMICNALRNNDKQSGSMRKSDEQNGGTKIQRDNEKQMGETRSTSHIDMNIGKSGTDLSAIDHPEQRCGKQTVCDVHVALNTRNNRGMGKDRPFPQKGRKSGPPGRSGIRPSLTSMQEAFCQTVIEVDERDNEDDNDDVFISGEKRKVDAATVIDVNAAVQTSPSLMSPLLSPLCAGPGSKLRSLESSFGSDKSKAASDHDTRPMIILAPDSMQVEVRSNALSTEDETSSTGTVNTQYSELSTSSNIENMRPHPPPIGKKSSGNNSDECGSRDFDQHMRTSEVQTSDENDLCHNKSETDAHLDSDCSMSTEKNTHKRGKMTNRTQYNQATVSDSYNEDSSRKYPMEGASQCVDNVNAVTSHKFENIIDIKGKVSKRCSKKNSDDTPDSKELQMIHQNRSTGSQDDNGSGGQSGSNNSHSSQESKMDGARRRRYKILLSNDSHTGTAGAQLSSTKLQPKVYQSDQEDTVDDPGFDSSQTGSAYSNQSRDYTVQQVSTASSGIFQLKKSEPDFPDVPKIRASVVSSEIGRQYEALLRSALEKERARKHLTVAETLHLAVVKLEKMVKERHLCRDTQMSDKDGVKGSCKFCDVERHSSGRRYTQELQKRYSLKPEVSRVSRQVSAGSGKQLIHRNVERTRSAPNELLLRKQSHDNVREGIEARMNSISSDFNDAVMSVTGDNLLVDLGKVSEELTSDMSFSDMTVADVKSIQAFHVLNDSESLSLADDEEKNKKEDRRMPLQRRRSLFARSSRSGSRLLIGQSTLHKRNTQSTIETKPSNEFSSFERTLSNDSDVHVHSASQNQTKGKETVDDSDSLPKWRQPNRSKYALVKQPTSLSVTSQVCADSVEGDNSPAIVPVEDNAETSKCLDRRNSCFIVVNRCQTEEEVDAEVHDLSKPDQLAAFRPESMEFMSQNTLHRSTSSERSSEPLAVPPGSPYQKLTPQLSHNSKRSPPLSPFSFVSTSPSLGAFLSSPLSPTTKSPPLSPTIRIGDSPVPSQSKRISVSPTIHLAPSTPPAKVTVELSSLSLQTSPIHEKEQSDVFPAPNSPRSKYRSEIFLQLPEQPDVDSLSGSSISPSSVGRSPMSPARLEYMPSFDELCDKAETIITNLQGMGVPDGQSFQLVQTVLASEKDGNGCTSSDGSKSLQKLSMKQVMTDGAQGRAEAAAIQPESYAEVRHIPPHGHLHGPLHGQHQKMHTAPQPQLTSTPHAGHSGVAIRDPAGDERGNQMAAYQHMLQSEASLRASVEAMEASLNDLKNKKEGAMEELKMLQEAVKRNKGDIQRAEEMARMSVEKSDGLRSELMVLEYQRDQARMALKDLEEGIAARRSTHRGEEAQGGAGDPLAQLGLTPEEIVAVVNERDQLRTQLEEMGSRVSRAEHTELERQLEQTKQELFESQKASRIKVEKMEEDLEENRGKIESLKLMECDLKKQLQELQEAMTKAEKEHQNQIQEKHSALEELRTKTAMESAENQLKLEESTKRVATLEKALLDKDVVTTRLQERIRGQGQEVLELTNKAEALERQKDATARKAEMTTRVAVVELRDKLLKEKEEELDQQKKMLEKAHTNILTNQQTQAAERQAQLEKEVQEKDAELKELRENLSQQEVSSRNLGEQLRKEAEEQIKKALQEQKAVWEEEAEKERQKEALAKEDAVAIETKYLKEDLKREQQLRDTLKTSVNNLKEEVEKLRDENMAAGREKVEAVSKAREEARQEIQVQLSQIREQMAQEKAKETERLQQKLRQQDEELTQLRAETKRQRQKERESSSAQSGMDHSYRSIVMELNEECRKTSNLVGSTPRKVPLFSSRNLKSDSPSQNGSPKQTFHSPGRTQVMAALSNLKATNDDLRNYIKTLRDDLEKQRRATARANREKENEVKKLVEAMGREKAQVFDGEREVEVDCLQRLVGVLQDSETSLQQQVASKDEELRQIQANMAAWKEETALKMARKFEDELNKELEVRLEESHSGSGSYRSSQSDQRMRSSALGTSTTSSLGSGDSSTTKLLRHLQDRVKHLRMENMTLKQAGRGDNSLDTETSFQRSLQLEERDQQVYRLEQKVKLLERQLWVAEERCRENAALLSQKTAENSRLEGALTQQTKELMKVERAYSKLSQSASTSPVP
ncbi:uncharacterized protein [Diadema setosum]|uniref:uncharacterized protein n=1 Tax=Diadema setosum TaxID=31175 RepID=UPI003B3B9B2A